MALDPRFITGADLEQYFVDKVTGEPLANGYVKFWEDESRTTPKNVYQLSGSPPNYVYEVLPNPLTLSSVGTPENANGDNIAIYYYPYDENGDMQYYYVEVFSENDVLQLTREGWPNITERDDPSFDASTTDNQISNSQFVDVSFFPDEGIVISFDGAITNVSYDIAPDWSVVISSNGAGSLTVNRVALEGALNIPTNPPYIMTFLPSGAMISSLKLVQRLAHNPGIWSTTTANIGYLAGYMLVSSVDGLNHTVQMQYSPSVAPAPQTIVSGTTGISGYKELYATIEVDSSVNTEDGDNGYVNIEVVLPVNGYVSVSSIQVKGLYANETISLYDQETVNRQEDHLFHYYNPLLQFKPIPSYLVGWDFPLNPAQFGESVSMSTIGNNKSKYLWDQTIGFQSVDNSWACSRGVQGEFLMTSSATTQMAIIQYLSKNEIFEIFNNNLSVNVNLTNVDVPDGTVATVSLWYCTDASLPSMGSNNSIVGSLDIYGNPQSFNGNWVEITRGDINNNRFNISNTSGYETVDFKLENYFVDDLEDAIDNGEFFAIVLGFSQTIASSTIGVMSISLVPGEIATIPAPETYQEVLKKCQYYYEKSYDLSVLPGTITNDGSITFIGTNAYDGSINTNIYRANFTLTYKNIKRADPSIAFYSGSSGLPSAIEVGYIEPGNVYPVPTSGTNPVDTNAADFSASQISRSNATLACTSASSVFHYTTDKSVNGGQTVMKFQYTLDSRLGLI